MVHSGTAKGRKRYRYYICLKAQKRGSTACPTRNLPAQAVEQFVIERLRAIREAPDLTNGVEGVNRTRLASAFAGLDSIWATLVPGEQARIVRLLVKRVEYDGQEGTVALSIRPEGVQALIEERDGAGKEARA